MDEIIINTDGGSRGNPGPAASAFVVHKNGKLIYEGSKNIGISTNNVAEYTAVLIAFEWLKENVKASIKSKPNIVFVLDSELVVKQLNGVYKVKDQNLKVIYLQIISLIKEIKSQFVFKHVPRNQNKRADFLVNREMDRLFTNN